MKTIDGDAAVWLLRKHSMYDAADLLSTMPAIHTSRCSKVSQAVSDFLTSGAAVLEIDTSTYKRPISCYQTYREYLKRKNITACFCYMDNGCVYLARVPGRATDGKTANIRN